MKRFAHSLARKVRYWLPRRLGGALPEPDVRWALHRSQLLAERGVFWAVGYFQADTGSAEDVIKQNLAAIRCFANCPGDGYLSIKAPPLDFNRERILAICKCAQNVGLPLVFDSHALDVAGPTLDIVAAVLDITPGTGLALPARWRRSESDARRFRDSPARIRLVKGEWPDPAWPSELSISANFLKLVELLAGRESKVAIATHDPLLAEHALYILRKAGTPCELEQLRGLPQRRTWAIARKLDVPIRIYLPFGPGWWPYAINEALARPHLFSWAVRDRFL